VRGEICFVNDQASFGDLCAVALDEAPDPLRPVLCQRAAIAEYRTALMWGEHADVAMFARGYAGVVCRYNAGHAGAGHAGLSGQLLVND
jgi:hypothetical protein